MDDGNILKRKNSTVEVNTENTENTENKQISPINELIVSSSGVDVGKLSFQDKERFTTWRHTTIPKDFLVGIVLKVADYDMIEDILEPDSIMIMSELTKMFIGEIVSKSVNDNITKEDIIRIMYTEDDRNVF